MANRIRDDNKSLKWIDIYFDIIFNKIFDKRIMIDDSNNLAFKYNLLSLRDMPFERRIKVGKSMNEILKYNKDFSDIGFNYIFLLGLTPNFEKLRQYIKNQQVFYYHKAVFVVIIKTLFILLHLIISIIIFYPKSGIVDSKFNILNSEILRLKLIYFLFFDLFYIMNEFYYFKNFERIKFRRNIVVLYQTIGYIFNGIIYILVISNKKNYVPTKENYNFFSKLIYNLEFVLLFFDLIKFNIKRK